MVLWRAHVCMMIYIYMYIDGNIDAYLNDNVVTYIRMKNYLETVIGHTVSVNNNDDNNDDHDINDNDKNDDIVDHKHPSVITVNGNVLTNWNNDFQMKLTIWLAFRCIYQVSKQISCD